MCACVTISTQSEERGGNDRETRSVICFHCRTLSSCQEMKYCEEPVADSCVPLNHMKETKSLFFSKIIVDTRNMKESDRMFLAHNIKQ